MHKKLAEYWFTHGEGPTTHEWIRNISLMPPQFPTKYYKSQEITGHCRYPNLLLKSNQTGHNFCEYEKPAQKIDDHAHRLCPNRKGKTTPHTKIYKHHRIQTWNNQTPGYQVARNCDVVGDALNFVKDVSNAILESKNRKTVYSSVVLPPGNDAGEQDCSRPNTPLLPLCPTRWAVKVKSMDRFVENYERVQATLQELVEVQSSLSGTSKTAIK